MRAAIAGALCMMFFWALTLSASADGFSIVLDPAFPEPGEAFTASVGNRDFSTPQKSVTWFVNGHEEAGDADTGEVALTASDAPMTLTARVALASGAVLEQKYMVAPVRVDLIAEPDSSVPPFYRGHPLPSSGTPIRVSALVFKNTERLTSGLSYIWRVNGVLQKGGAGYGVDALTIRSNFEKSMRVSVEVLDASQRKIAEDTIEIPIIDPEVVFYERNPLRGLSLAALPEPFTAIGAETVLRAETYFMDAELPSADLLSEWTLNGKEAAPRQEDPREITVQKGTHGDVRVAFSIHNLRQLLQSAKADLTIRF